MYQCVVHIVSVSREELLQQRIEGCVPPPRFAYELRTVPALSAEDARDADVVLLDDGGELSELRRSLALFADCHRPEAKLILCAEKAVLAQLDDAELGGVFDLWEKPLSEREFRFRFRGLQRALSLEKDLWLSENYLDTTINSIPDLVWYKDLRGEHVKVNDSFCRTVHKTRDQIEGQDHCTIWDLDVSEYERGKYICMESDREVIDRRETCVFDEKVKTRDGMKQLRTCKSPLFDLDGSVMGTVGVAADVTDLRNMDLALSLLIGNLPFAMLVCDRERRILKQNANFTQSFGLPDGALRMTPYDDWRDHCFADIHHQPDGLWDEAVLHTGSEDRIIEIREEEIRDMFGECSGYFCLFIDVTAQRQMERQIIRNANTDFLTGLYNRRYLYSFAQKNSTGCFALLYLDLDNFKTVNDLHGHQEGDMALIATAEELRRSFPEDLIARVGGDEFVVVLKTDSDRESVRALRDGLAARLNAVYRADERFARLSASIGFAVSGGEHRSLDELIRESDAAMYRMKRKKKLHPRA